MKPDAAPLMLTFASALRPCLALAGPFAVRGVPW